MFRVVNAVERGDEDDLGGDGEVDEDDDEVLVELCDRDKDGGIFRKYGIRELVWCEVKLKKGCGKGDGIRWAGKWVGGKWGGSAGGGGEIDWQFEEGEGGDSQVEQEEDDDDEEDNVDCCWKVESVLAAAIAAAIAAAAAATVAE